MKEIIVDKNNSGQKLPQLLKKILTEASMGFIYKMLRKKNITLNDKKASGDEVVRESDVIKIFFSDETFLKLSGQENKGLEYDLLKNLPHDINIIYQDNDKIIINKPVGLLSQKAKEEDVSINEMAISYMINSGCLTLEQYNIFHPSIVNRLDRNTSGIIVFAKNLSAAQKLSREIKDRSAIKMYRTIVKGQILNESTINGYLYKDEETNTVTILDNEYLDAKQIITTYNPISYNPVLDLTYLEVHLVTGRTHQIRAHLSSIGHPILGDNKYGDIKLNNTYNRKYQLLHAYSIQFCDGSKYIAEIPEDYNVYI